MNIFIDILNNKPIVSAFFGWIIAQVLKVPIGFILNKKWDIRKVLQSGGMPSSHGATVTAVATSIGIIEGYSSSVFAIALVLSIVVMYDAAGVRRDAGRHAKMLNDIMETLRSKRTVSEEKLREWIGHTPFEVLVGAVLGVIVGIVVSLV